MKATHLISYFQKPLNFALYAHILCAWYFLIHLFRLNGKKIIPQFFINMLILKNKKYWHVPCINKNTSKKNWCTWSFYSRSFKREVRIWKSAFFVQLVINDGCSRKQHHHIKQVLKWINKSYSVLNITVLTLLYPWSSCAVSGGRLNFGIITWKHLH